MTGVPHRIAVVDDDIRLLESLENLFESAGYQVRAFASGQGLIQAGLSGIDCVVTDIGMPGMDGFELNEAVKRVRADLPVFLVTGRHDVGDRGRAQAAGIRGLFEKPFNGPALLAGVGEALRS
jgi:FixJ family two-component response regulator